MQDNAPPTAAQQPHAFAEKVPLARLAHLPLADYPSERLSRTTPQRISFIRDGLRHDMLWAPASDPAYSHRMFVVFAGSVDRTRLTLPVFHRWSWAARFPGNCLFVADPSLWQHESLQLAWYCGNSAVDAMDAIVTTVQDIASQQGIATKNIFGYGSSAGGFTSLRLAASLPGAGAVAINPQINVLDYYRRHVDRFLGICMPDVDYETAASMYGERLDLLTQLPLLSRARIIYIQNSLDPHHVKSHFSKFCAALGQNSLEHDTGLFRRYLFSDENGHSAAEPNHIFQRTMQTILRDPDWN